jgi:hypothetical protein
MKPITKIDIQVIDHTAQRYDTSGDWWFEPDGTLHLAVSKMSDPRYALLVAMHELTEALLCHHAGITTEQVDTWDIGEGGELDEPGDDPRAPYHEQHVAAMFVERWMADKFGVDWTAYAEAFDDLPAHPGSK